jgi:hypothetical protein
MKPKSKSDELSAEQVRNLTTAERRERFQACRARMQAAYADLSTEETHWHPIDDDMPLDGLNELPPARPGDTRTPLVWVKFRDRSVGKVVVSRGRYDYDGGTWSARLSSVEDGDVVGTVVAVAWASIGGGRPWDGPTVREHVGDPC